MRYSTVDQPQRRRRDLIVAGALTLISLLLTTGAGRQTDLAINRFLRGTLLRPFIATHEVFSERAGLAARVEGLVAQRDSLALLNSERSDLEAENGRLRALLELPDREAGDYFVAELVPGHSPAGEPNRFLLRTSDPGLLDPPLGVATFGGLVGVVRTVSGRVGLGDYWTHPDFRVAVITSDGTTAGIVRPIVTDRGERLMLLEGVPFQTQVARGTRLVTSGVGGIYARGLTVGHVLAGHEAQSGWTHSFLVEPAVQPGTEELVLGWRPGSLADTLYALPDEVGADAAGDSGVAP